VTTNFEKEKLKSMASAYGFSEEEVYDIKKRFDDISEKGILTKMLFRYSLGLLGLNESVAQRIFKMIDIDNDDKANFEDFLRYLSVLISGNDIEKALWSFKFMSDDKSNFFSLKSEREGFFFLFKKI
jgi:1-phosphatidylinositol-4-phosphate 5-kinase